MIELSLLSLSPTSVTSPGIDSPIRKKISDLKLEERISKGSDTASLSTDSTSSIDNLSSLKETDDNWEDTRCEALRTSVEQCKRYIQKGSLFNAQKVALHLREKLDASPEELKELYRAVILKGDKIEDFGLGVRAKSISESPLRYLEVELENKDIETITAQIQQERLLQDYIREAQTQGASAGVRLALKVTLWSDRGSIPLTSDAKLYFCKHLLGVTGLEPKDIVRLVSSIQSRCNLKIGLIEVGRYLWSSREFSTFFHLLHLANPVEKRSICHELIKAGALNDKTRISNGSTISQEINNLIGGMKNKKGLTGTDLVKALVEIGKFDRALDLLTLMKTQTEIFSSMSMKQLEKEIIEKKEYLTRQLSST